MRNYLPTIGLLIFFFDTFSQTPITAVTPTTISSTTSSYTNGANTYNWGSGNSIFVNGFTAGGLGYTYASFLSGNVKLRRVNNAGTSGIFTLIWAEATSVTAPTFTMLPTYQNDMELFFNNRTYNKGSDNFLDNTSGNSNNIERMDWILTAPYSTSTPSKVGFAVFERGAAGAHDPFCISAILSLDVSGNPSSYSNIVRVVGGNYGDPGPNVTYEILKAPFPSNLLDAGNGTQSRGGTIISLQNLGIAAGTPIYGYSLFSNDLPGGATPANLVDFTNPTNFPNNTGGAGGIDLVAVTGVYVENSILPVKFISFSGSENNDLVTLKWLTENEVAISKYEIERSTDGIHFIKIKETAPVSRSTGSGSYVATDDITSVANKQVWYRINQVDMDGSHSYSRTIVINRKTATTGISIFPNPVINELYITVSSAANSKASLSLFNAAGVKITNQQIILVKGNNSFSLDNIPGLPKGIYQLVFKKEDGTVLSKKIVKE